MMRLFGDATSDQPIIRPLDLITKLTIAGVVISLMQLGVELFAYRRDRRRHG
jgi:hypothetical protein